MQSWLARKVISYVMDRLRRGDVRPTLFLDAPDVQLTFPGRNSWSGVFRGKDDVERWLRRFVAAGIQIYPEEVVATGMPWKTTVCVRGTDRLDGPDRTPVYENRFVIWGHMAWGRLKEYEVYEDTHRPEALDAWLAAQRPELAVPVRPQ
jgi:ketosteroid isomerase-like protein